MLSTSPERNTVCPSIPRPLSPSTSPRSVLVLGGGPDAEREVSIISSRAITEALNASGRFSARLEIIDRLTVEQLRALPGDLIFPALHGGYGEGGPLQDVLEADGRPFVGSRARAARQAMDKLSTKLLAQKLRIPTPPVWILDPRDGVAPCDLPLVIKPVHEGSTVGLYVCRTEADWKNARVQIDAGAGKGTQRAYMIEPFVGGSGAGPRELTVGILDSQPLPVIEIRPAEGLYDYEAKYTREDTAYLLDPPLPPGIREKIHDQTLRLAQAIGVRHLARADFMIDDDGTAWFLEINTLPGFTGHSLVPMAAARIGLPMPELCAKLVDMAVRDHAAVR